jgi:tight adherence protein C
VTFALVGVQEIVPLLVLVAIVAGIFMVLSMLSNRNSRAQERLERISRPASLAEIEDPKTKKERFANIMQTAKALSGPLMPQTELEQSELKIKLANAGFRSDSAVAVYLGLRFASLIGFLVLSLLFFLPKYGFTLSALKPIVAIGGIGYYLPSIVLWFLRKSRQEQIFLSLPDALDLLVVCVESGLGLDAAMRKVCDEMKDHAKVMRKQLAEEKAAKTAVQLIFPLVLFIFPGIFVVLVGPAAISIMKTMMKQQT